MNKVCTVIVVSVALLGMVSFSGCGSKAKATEKTIPNINVETVDENAKDTETEVATTAAQGKGYLLVEQFVSKLQSGDTADIMDMVYVQDSTLISAEDVVWAVERNGLSDLSGNTSAKYTLESVSKTSDTEDVDVLDSTGTKLLTLRTILDNENNCKIDVSSVCVENYQIVVPAGATVTFNSIPVDAKYITGTYGDFNLQSIITLPLVTGQTVTVDVVTPFGTLTSEVLPVTSEEPLDLTAIPIALTEADAALVVASECYNTAYENSAQSGVVPAADIASYFSPNSKPSVLTDVSSNISIEPKVSLTNLVATKISVETSTIIAIEFSCEYHWTRDSGATLDTDLDTTILMEAQADGTFLIYEVPEMRFFLEPIF